MSFRRTASALAGVILVSVFTSACGSDSPESDPASAFPANWSKSQDRSAVIDGFKSLPIKVRLSKRSTYRGNQLVAGVAVDKSGAKVPFAVVIGESTKNIQMAVPGKPLRRDLTMSRVDGEFIDAYRVWVEGDTVQERNRRIDTAGEMSQATCLSLTGENCPI